MEILELPVRTKKLLKHYLKLKIANKKVVCPYYQNVWKKKKRVMLAGKGLPHEIENWAMKLIKIKPVLKELPVNDLRFRLTLAGLGVDCSGLAINLLSQYFQDHYKLNLQKVILTKKINLLTKLRVLLRFRTCLSADMLTSPPIANEISLNQVRPGDLIKLGKHHLAIITKIWKTKEKINKFEYIHSTSNYFDEYGVRVSTIEINNINASLENQTWAENYQGKNWTKEGYLNSPPDKRGLRRIVP